MHSRIFQLSEEKIDPADRLTEHYLDYDFSYPIDYIYNSDPKEREEDIEWFLGAFRHNNVTFDHSANTRGFNETLIFRGAFKQDYFKNNWIDIKNAVKNLELEKFSESSLATYKIQKLIDDQFGFKVYYEGTVLSLDRFIRDVAKKDTTYYIGGILGYHA